MNPKANIRQAAVAGQFYPGSPHLLRTAIEQLFAATPPVSSAKPVRALIVPHAGYLYSGATAAAAFAHLEEEADYDRVFLIGTSHQALFDGIAVARAHSFSTPLGDVACDHETTEKLRTNPLFAFDSAVHLTEHSLEVALPFLQVRLKKPFSIVPLLMGTDRPETCRKAALVLGEWFNGRNLFVISTDFSHYPDARTATETDARTSELVAKGDPNELHRWLHEIKQLKNKKLATAMCGAGAVMTLMNLCKTEQNLQMIPLHYSHSGEAGAKDLTRVVGYQSMMVVSDETLFASESEKRWLLGLARRAIENHITRETGEVADTEPYEKIGDQVMGIFVSIYTNGALRGCIGRLEPKIPLRRLIAEMTVAAAFSDTRFKPIKASDLQQLEIEISLLTPLRRIDRAEDFEPGKHGIFIRSGYRSGTFLPQVANSTGWNRMELLSHCSEQKAGLGREGWKTAELYVYEAFVINSKEFPPATRH